LIIRPFRNSDGEDVRYICLNSEGKCRLPKRSQRFLLNTYCNYFIEKEPENCFVAADDNDKAVGYILSTENFDKFYPVYLNEYVSRLGKFEFSHKSSALRCIESQEKYKNEYPAHFHVDILPEYQKLGLGSKLLSALCEHLKSKGVGGVMLTVYYKNENAVKFYEKHGFTLLETKKTSFVYGLKLD